MIHEFDPVIYPRKLWVTYDATTEELNTKFPNGDYYGNRFKDEDSYYAITYHIGDADGKGGVLIRFFNKEESMQPWNIAHEAIHAAGRILQYVGVEADFENDEAFAYLTTWIVKCCCKVKEGK